MPSSFLGVLDVMLSYESAGTPALTSLTQYAAHREQFGMIPYAATFDATYVKAAVKSATLTSRIMMTCRTRGVALNARHRMFMRCLAP
ncbi:MAG: hypothetical protein ABJB12_19805 [Pseudomonadota bacterium]